MLPIHTILYPTDFSERSAYALPLASALARDYGARLIVLHVVSPPAMSFGEGVMLPIDAPTLADEARRSLDDVQVATGVRVERRLEQGDPAAEVLRVAGDVRADLIVMGTHGRTGLGRLFMGSVAEQVMRKAPCPVLTLKTPFTLEDANVAEAEARAVAVPAM